MKKILLLIIVLLPFLGIGQTQLVRWNGSDDTNYSTVPSVFVSNVSANNASGTNSFIPSIANYFRGVDYGGSQSDTQFMEFALSANTRYNIALSNFSFTHRRDTNGPQNFGVKYSTDGVTCTNIVPIHSVF